MDARWQGDPNAVLAGGEGIQAGIHAFLLIRPQRHGRRTRHRGMSRMQGDRGSTQSPLRCGYRHSGGMQRLFRKPSRQPSKHGSREAAESRSSSG
jgi:hypothetical protein